MPSAYARKTRGGTLTVYLSLRSPSGRWLLRRASPDIQEMHKRSPRAALGLARKQAEQLEAEWCVAQVDPGRADLDRLEQFNIRPAEAEVLRPPTRRQPSGPLSIEEAIREFEARGATALRPRSKDEYLKSLHRFARWIHDRGRTGVPVARCLQPDVLLEYKAHRAAELAEKAQPPAPKRRGKAQQAAPRATHGMRALLADMQGLRALEKHLLAIGALQAETVSRTWGRPRQPRKLRRLPTEEEIGILLAAAKDYRPARARASVDYCLALRLVIEAGLRHAELLSLRWRDLDLGPSPRVLVTAKEDIGFRPKSAEERMVPLSLSLASDLTSYRDSLPVHLAGKEAPVLSASRARPRHLAIFPRPALRAIFEAAGLSADGLHALRALACVRWLAAGVPPEEVRRMMGHDKLTTTMEIYGRYIQGDEWIERARAKIAALPPVEANPVVRFSTRGLSTRGRRAE